MRIDFIICIVTAVFITYFSSKALAWEARVVAVTDGDTLTVEPVQGGARVKIRLHGIDTPERKQPYGEAARGFAFKVSLYKDVDITALYKDRYKRVVAVVTFPDGDTLQAKMLEAGFAWVWTRYCKNCQKWEALQQETMRKQRGLWADDNPVPPWEWRRQR